MRSPRYALIAALGLLPLVPACHCAGDTMHDTTGVVGPTSEHELNCNCIVNFSGLAQDFGAPASVAFDFALCLPPDLNTATADPTQAAAIAAMSSAQYTTAVTNYCSNQVGNVITGVIGLLKSDACGQFTVSCSPEAPPGQMRATDLNPVCDSPCAPVACDMTNCMASLVIDSGDNVHPEMCKCTQVTGCSLTSDVFCDRPPGNADPPTIASGLLTTLLSHPIVARLDHSQSTASVFVTVSFGILGSASDTENPNVAGKVTLYGRPCPGASCDMLMDLSLFPDDFNFDFGLIGGTHSVQNFSIVGGTGPVRVHIDPDGTGHVPAGTLSYIADGILDGSTRSIYQNTNDQEILFNIDFANKKFSLSNGMASFTDGSGTLNLAGTIDDLPPTASAGPPQSVECASHVGTPVILDGSASSDPDNDIMNILWWRGAVFDPTGPIGAGATLPVTAPLGVNDYQVSVTDKHFLMEAAATKVTVTDTIAPMITAPANVVVECTAPMGQVVDIGTATTADICDPSPTLQSDAPPEYQVGTFVVHYLSKDASGNVGMATQSITVQDTTPPTLDVSVMPTEIWPPNKDFIPITVTASASDVCSSSVPITLISATATEPGGSKPVPASSIVGADIGTADFSFMVEADRSGTAPMGRFYTFTYDAVDAHGNHTVKSVVVNVPHSHR